MARGAEAEPRGASAHGLSERSPPFRPGAPTCGMKLWITPVPRPVRFYDLRRTHATLLRKARVDLGTVQKALGHSSPETTAGTYDHSELEDERETLERVLSFDAAPREGTLAHGAHMGHETDPEKRKPAAPSVSRVELRASRVGATGFEPATTCTPSDHGPSGRRGNGWQRLATPRFRGRSRGARIPRRGTDRTPWHGKRCAGGAQRWVRVIPSHRGRGRPAPASLPCDRVPALPRGMAPARSGLERHPGTRAVARGVPAPRRLSERRDREPAEEPRHGLPVLR
jgi:hypothetical protein